jgi:hypothetical protein
MLNQMQDSLQHHCSTKQQVDLQAFLEGVQRGNKILVDQTNAQPVLQSPNQLNLHPQLSLLSHHQTWIMGCGSIEPVDVSLNVLIELHSHQFQLLAHSAQQPTKKN